MDALLRVVLVVLCVICTQIVAQHTGETLNGTIGIIDRQGYDYGVRDMNFRDFRYCEILSSRNAVSIWQINNFTAYNSLLNGCPLEKWKEVTAATVRAVDGAYLVRLNGPRYWAFDTVTANSTLVSNQVTLINNIRMVVVGIVEVSYYEMLAKMLFFQMNFYQERTVRRATIYVFYKDLPISFLQSPEGHTYVMQSYSEQFYPVSRDNLPTLGEKLDLPAGWTYNYVFLQHELLLEAINAIGVIVNDNFYNVYSQVDNGLLLRAIGNRPVNSFKRVSHEL